MVVIGALLFGGALLWGGSRSGERPRITIPPQRLEIMRQAFVNENRRPPTAEEQATLLDYLVDEEVLYQYALKLGMHEQPVAQRRLAQIASFVEANPHEARSEKERAAEAMSLGLHHGDLVVRRVLIDGARRLIRAVVLTRQPNPAMVEEYLATNRELFLQPARIRITHVAVDGFKWPRGCEGAGYRAAGAAPAGVDRTGGRAGLGRRAVRALGAAAAESQGPPDPLRHHLRAGSEERSRARLVRPRAIPLRLPPGLGPRAPRRRVCRRSRRSASGSSNASCTRWPTSGWRCACSNCAPSSTSSCRSPPRERARPPRPGARGPAVGGGAPAADAARRPPVRPRAPGARGAGAGTGGRALEAAGGAGAGEPAAPRPAGKLPGRRQAGRHPRGRRNPCALGDHMPGRGRREDPRRRGHRDEPGRRAAADRTGGRPLVPPRADGRSAELPRARGGEQARRRAVATRGSGSSISSRAGITCSSSWAWCSWWAAGGRFSGPSPPSRSATASRWLWPRWA